MKNLNKENIGMKIWEGESEMMGETIGETRGEDIKEKFLTALCEIISKILEINYNDRRITTSLLKSSLKKDIMNRHDGLLDQFLHHELEKIGGEINRCLGIDEKIRPDYASHAKLRDHIDAIKDRLEAASSMLYDKPIEVKDNGGGGYEEQEGEDTENSSSEKKKREKGS